jgi:ribosomal protein S6--L-glutamate ligase
VELLNHKVTAEERRIAIKAAKAAMDLKVAGVDMQPSKGTALLEVNSSPD